MRLPNLWLPKPVTCRSLVFMRVHSSSVSVCLYAAFSGPEFKLLPKWVARRAFIHAASRGTILELQKQQQFHEQFRAEPLFMRLELLELLELLKMNRVRFTQT